MTTESTTLLDAVLTDPAMKSTHDVVSPYLPVLRRLGKDGLDAFVNGARTQDWERIDRDLYEQMTEDERDALSSQVLKDARAAVKAAHESDRQWRDDLLRLTLAIVLSAV